MNNENEYPFFLQSYANLKTHFEEQFHGLSSNEKGDLFLDFVKRLIPHTRIGRRFEDVQERKKTHDQGIDLFAENPGDNHVLLVQSKYTLRDVENFNGVFSKFRDYQIKKYDQEIGQKDLFAFSGIDVDGNPITYYQLINLHDLSRIKEKFEKSYLPAGDFYKQLVGTDRLEIVDGHDILRILRNSYRKANFIVSDFVLEFETELVSYDDVYVGIVSSTELKKLYETLGDALFFDNIRDFLNSTEVNEEIKKTVIDQPQRLLALNNGVVLKATQIEEISSKKIRLVAGSIINGCQTTLTIIKNATQECHVLAKIVRVDRDHAWDITRSANFQNRIGRFDLELSQFLRPQIVKKMTNDSAFAYQDNKSAIAILDAIYQDEIVYDELRDLFVGLFSREPNNIFDKGYTNLMPEVAARFYEDQLNATQLFEQLFTIFKTTNNIASRLQSTQGRSDIYQRFFKEDKTAYRAFITLLAASAATDVDLSETISDPDAKYELIHKFLDETVSLIHEDSKKFRMYYRYTIGVLSAADKGRDKTEVQQYLWKYIRQTGFEIFLERVRQQVDLALDLEDIANNY